MKRFLIGWVLVFIGLMLGTFIIHGMLLHVDYARVPEMFRPQTETWEYFPFMVLAQALMAGAFVRIYAHGVRAKAWLAQGIRFGLAIALLAVVPTYTSLYVAQPIPGAHVVKQIACDGSLALVLGVIAAFVYRQPAGS
jgi:hypothetical protein